MKRLKVQKLLKEIEKISQKNNEELLNNNFGIEVIIPKEYKVIYNSDSIFWATFNPPKSEEIKNMLITRYIIGDIKDLIKEIIFIKNQIR